MSRGLGDVYKRQAYGGGFHPVLLGLADALPYTAFTRKNLD